MREINTTTFNLIGNGIFVKGFVFIITDKQHNIYYASDNVKEVFGIPYSQLKKASWIDYIKGPTPQFIKQLIEYDLKSMNFFNGYLSFQNDNQLWYCDYGKRFDVNGNQTGYDLVITHVNKDASDYMGHFYQNLEQKVSDSPNNSAIAVYQEEQALIQKNVGTEYHEFLLALQADYEN